MLPWPPRYSLVAPPGPLTDTSAAIAAPLKRSRRRRQRTGRRPPSRRRLSKPRERRWRWAPVVVRAVTLSVSMCGFAASKFWPARQGRCVGQEVRARQLFGFPGPGRLRGWPGVGGTQSWLRSWYWYPPVAVWMREGAGDPSVRAYSFPSATTPAAREAERERQGLRRFRIYRPCQHLLSRHGGEDRHIHRHGAAPCSSCDRCSISASQLQHHRGPGRRGSRPCR